MRILAPFGFYGWGNIGDEGTLQGFAQLLARSGRRVQVTVGSRDPAHTSRVEPAFRYFNASSRDPRRWLAILRANAHAIIGGTPIMDIEGDWPLSDVAPLVRSAEGRKIPFACIGVGTETLRREQSRRLMATEIAPRVRHWSVRCDGDRQRLTGYGVPPERITVAADMAWLIEPAASDYGRSRLQSWGVDPRQPLIGVNLVNESLILDQHPHMAGALAIALDELAYRMDARVIFLANEVREDAKYDKAAAQHIIRRMKRADRATLAPNEYFSPQQMMSIIDCCDLTLSMRYHFCLFSVLQGTPFIAIQRSGKVADLCQDMAWPAAVTPPGFHAGEIVEHGINLHRDASRIKEQLKHCIRTMRERALRNIIALEALRDSRAVAIAKHSAAGREL